MFDHFFHGHFYERIEIFVVPQDIVLEEQVDWKGEVFMGQCPGIQWFDHLLFDHRPERVLPDIDWGI